MSWLLLFVPIAVALEILAPERHQLVFAAAGLAILPLAGWMGRATEQLASRLGEGVGGLLNATFGNAAELIIALAALRAGLHEVVKASLAGSIIGNPPPALSASGSRSCCSACTGCPPATASIAWLGRRSASEEPFLIRS